MRTPSFLRRPSPCDPSSCAAQPRPAFLVRISYRRHITAMALLGLGGSLFFAAGTATVSAYAQKAEASQSERVKSIEQRMGKLRETPDAERGKTTRQIALDIRELPDPAQRVDLAAGLANLATEGDFGAETLQEVATTLARALQEHPLPEDRGQPAYPYMSLAQLVRYEKVKVSLDAPPLAAALDRLKAEDLDRQKADFTLTDLQGKKWNLKSLRGKVVLVNFWATWCPPCRKELPDLEALYKRFKSRGFVVLGISDEPMKTVQPFVVKQKMTYPILLDPGRKTGETFHVQGIPRSLIYDRKGKLAAQAIDMRTERQLLALLAQAGLR